MAKSPVIVTRDSLRDMLANPNPEFVGRVIGKALVAIYARQTQAEQSSDATVEDNGIGFAGADAHGGSLTAKFFMKHNTLLDWQIDAWSKVQKSGYPRLCKYHKQLNEVAQAKAAATTPKLI